MRAFIVSFLSILFFVSNVFGEKQQVSLRASEKPGTIRLVFETEDAMNKNAKVYHSYSLVKIEFPAEFNLVSVETPKSVEVSHKGPSIFVNIAGLKDIKVFRLSEPSRLVIDAKVDKTHVEKTDKEEPEELAGLSELTMVIDPGHGGYNIGLVGGDYKEKDIVLSVARSLRYAAKKEGAEVFLTRYSDKYVTIGERIHSVYQKETDIFFSLHLSSAPDFVVYYARMDTDVGIQDQYRLKYRQFMHLKASKKLAKFVASALQNRFKRAVKVKEMPLPLLTSMDSAAIYIELPDGRFFDYGKTNRYAIVNALLKGIVAYEGS